jgi:isocitrate/isopropylmalate dehydrogenase
LTRVAVVEGEDASPEAVRPVVALLDDLDLGIEWVHPPAGADAVPVIDSADCALFGATSGASAAALFHLRWGRGTFANVRPIRYMTGALSPLAAPRGIDMLIVRENLEDLYVMAEGQLDHLAAPAPQSLTTGLPVDQLGPGCYAVKVITEAGSERAIRHAFELAATRPGPSRVTCSAKYNMLPATDGLFVEVARTVAKEYPDIPFEVLLVDDLAHRLVRDPQRFDVIVLPNLYGDILSDLAAGLIGGLGLAPSGCYGPDYAYFEPAHGTAPDIAGTGTINPSATLLSATMMLDHLGQTDASRAVVAALEAVYATGAHLTPDQGGTASAVQFCDAVEAALRRPPTSA